MNTVTVPSSADPHHPRSRWAERLAGARFFTFSLLLHLGLVIGLGTIVLYRSQQEAVEFISNSSSGLLTDMELPHPTTPEAAQEKPTETSAATTPNLQSPNITVDAVTTTAGSTFAVNSSPINVGTSGLEKALSSGNKGTGGIAGLGGTGTGTGNGMTKFFGTKAAGQNIVLVVDVSGSMVQGSGKSGKTYGELEKEVCRVIRELDMKAKFGIVVFSSDARTFRSQLASASNDEKSQAIAWLKKQTPEIYIDPKADEKDKAFHRGTRADRGLEEAFKMGPDVVFFVSDGAPTGSTPKQIVDQVMAAEVNLPRVAPVHTIAYLAGDGQKFMMDLASRTGGLFREVNPKDIDK